MRYYSPMHPVSEVRVMLHKLDGAPADAIESQTLDCKTWDADPRARDAQLREIWT